MIVINEKAFPTRESLDELIQSFYDKGYKPEHKEYAEIYEGYLNDCFDADQKLQEAINNYISPDFVCFSILPVRDIDDLDSFSFELGVMNDERDSILKSEEIFFHNLCAQYFSEVKTFTKRVIEYYEEP